MKPVPYDKKRIIRKLDHLTRPPRLEGKAKNAKMYSSRKPRRDSRSRSKLLASIFRENYA